MKNKQKSREEIKMAEFRFSIRLKGNMETQPTPIIKVLPTKPEAFVVEGINVFQKLMGDWVLTKQVDAKPYDK